MAHLGFRVGVLGFELYLAGVIFIRGKYREVL